MQLDLFGGGSGSSPFGSPAASNPGAFSPVQSGEYIAKENLHIYFYFNNSYLMYNI